MYGVFLSDPLIHNRELRSTAGEAVRGGLSTTSSVMVQRTTPPLLVAALLRPLYRVYAFSTVVPPRVTGTTSSTTAARHVHTPKAPAPGTYQISQPSGPVRAVAPWRLAVMGPNKRKSWSKKDGNIKARAKMARRGPIVAAEAANQRDQGMGVFVCL